MRTRSLPVVVQALLTPEPYPHAAPRIALIETHISYVVLTGEYAYKLKKSIDLGFLDFSTLAKRRHACFEELRLNERLAPRLYISVVALRMADGTLEFAIATPEGHPDDVEYAVRMREFPQEAQLDRVIAASEPPSAARPFSATPGARPHAAQLLEQAALRIAAFHDTAPRAPDAAAWGSPAAVLAPVRENFAQIEPRLADDNATEQATIGRLKGWSEAEAARLAPTIAARKAAGFVRECHGDLHLTNLVVLEAGVCAFDGIEFDPALRWIDIISDVAFLVMDLGARGRPDLAAVFLNSWLEQTGDFESLVLLRFYLVYRALVRAKVAAISTLGADAAATGRYRLHTAQAANLIRTARPAVVLMCGVSGSGKSWLARRLAHALPALRVRSDVERKRLFGLGPLDNSRPLAADIYTPDADRRTLDRLSDVAQAASASGYPLLVDATFMRRAARDHFRDVATALGAAFAIVECRCTEEVLIERVLKRATGGTDASEAGVDTVQEQLPAFESPSLTEPDVTVVVDTDRDVNLVDVVARLRSALAR